VSTSAILYAAKSTEDKNQSIPDQFRDGLTKCQEEGWEVVAEFKDEKFSAYSGNRGPGLKEATELAERVAAELGEPCMLVAQHSDRFARGAGDRPGASDSLLEVWLRMRRVDVHLRTYGNDAMMHKPVTVAVASEQAHEESKRKSEAVKKGMRRRAAEKGKPSGGPRTLGLAYSEHGYVHVRAEVPTIQRIFAELKAGKAQIQLARDLEADGVPTAGGGRWHQGTIARIARNPVYKGCIVHNGEVHEGAHDPVVDPELWEEVNDLLTRKAKSTAGKGRGRPPAGRHLFRKGMLRCENGGSLVPLTKPNRTDGLYEVYYCYDHKLGRCSCGLSALRRAPIDTAIYNYFEQVALDVDATKEQLAKSRDRKLAEVRVLHSQAQGEKLRVEEQLARVRRDYLDRKIEADDWNSFQSELTADLGSADAQVTRLAEQLEEVEAWSDLRDMEQEALASLAEIRKAIGGEVKDAAGADAVRAALIRLFDGFVVKRVRPGIRVHAELAWQGDYVIEPIVAEHAIEGDTQLRPIIRREPIYDSGAINRWASPSDTASCGPASTRSSAAAPTLTKGRAGSAS
jgi:DNA invertase Pin-like site-specific DNA recombinase